MTSQQKVILIVLGLVNVLCFCCGLPIVFLFLSGDFSETTASLPELSPAPIQSAPMPSVTPSLTPTPRATATRVIQAPLTPVLTPAEPGWTLYPMSQERFAIAVPSAWTAQNFDPATLASLMQKVQEKNPQYAKTLGSQAPQMAAAGIKFIAIDLTPQPDVPNFATNLNILRHAVPASVTMDKYVSENLKQLEASGVAKSITHRRVKLPAG